jgi:hypothetical protein
VNRLLLALPLLVGCVHRVEPVGPPRTVKLLAAADDVEFAQNTKSRPDFEIDTRDGERTPKEVATGETPLLERKGLDLALYGDDAKKAGIQVDNLVLLEVLAADGKVLNRAIVGYTEGLLLGNERIDVLGRNAFAFEPGEIRLTELVPESGTFKLRATVLDNGGVGRCSDVFLALEPRPGSGPDDLRTQ